MSTPLKSRYLWQLAGLWLAAAPVSASAYCVGWDQTLPNYDPRYYSVAQEFRRAQYVVKAKVIRETWVGEDGKAKALRPPFQFQGPRPWGFDPYAGAFYDLQIETIYKGKPPCNHTGLQREHDGAFLAEEGSKDFRFRTVGNVRQAHRQAVYIGHLRQFQPVPEG